MNEGNGPWAYVSGVKRSSVYEGDPTVEGSKARPFYRCGESC